MPFVIPEKGSINEMWATQSENIQTCSRFYSPFVKLHLNLINVNLYTVDTIITKASNCFKQVTIRALTNVWIDKNTKCGTIYIITLLTLYWIKLLRVRMDWGRLVVKARLFLKLTSHLFTKDTKLYRLCEGLNRVELKSLSLRAWERQ